MNRYALDTSRVTDLLRGDHVLMQQLESASEVLIPLVVLGELRAGFLAGTHSARNEKLLNTFLAKPTVRVLHPDEETASLYARVYAALRRAGRPIPENDMWIAALALQHELTLLTRDRHFQQVPQLLLS